MSRLAAAFALVALAAAAEAGEPLAGVLTDPDRAAREGALVPLGGGIRPTQLVVDLAPGLEPERWGAIALRTARAGATLAGWIAVARDPEAARAHPEWTSVPQHPVGGRRVRVGDWVSIDNPAVFAHALARVKRLAGQVPGLERLYLAELQGGPSGCGCGSPLCKSWDNSPGRKVSGGSPYDPAHHPVQVRKFLEAVRAALPGVAVVPVLTSECEPEADPGCRSGGIQCRLPCATRTWPRLVFDLAREPGLGLLCLYKEQGRGTPAWVEANLRRFTGLAPRQRAIAVLQGWNVTEAEVALQLERARAAGVKDVILARAPVRQDWTPIEVKG